MKDDGDPFWVWVIYFNPSDYPGKYVLRAQYADMQGDIHVSAEAYVCDTIEPLQEQMISRGLVKILRDPADDPVIVESWI